MSSQPQPTPNPFIKQEPEPEPEPDSEPPITMDLDNDNDNDNDDANHNCSYSFKDNDGDMGRDPDEIRSLDSDELRETRPNRWRGHPSTWRTWTERERRTWSALENARRADLAVHLYNAFGLRKGLREAPEVLGEEAGGGDWKPGGLWTAWPMRANEVPDDDLLPKTRDVNERFTLRREEGRPVYAGENLEGEISATMLRCAKERFRKRNLQGQYTKGEVVLSIEKPEESDIDATDAVETTEMDEVDSDAPLRTPKRRRKLASPTFTPVPSTDDDRSYALLRSAARRIMSTLDDTLMVLHNSRVAGLANMSESSASDEDETEPDVAPKKRELSQSPPTDLSLAPKKRRGGRPRKVHVPREGETEQEMLVRVAREGKRRIPSFSPIKTEPGEESKRSGGKSRSKSRSPVIRGSRASSRSSRASSRSSSASSETYKEKRLGRWGLRDWRDVLGAAALAGFSPAVIARATQRCSTLFREEMTIHTLPEQPEKDRIRTVRYVPGGPLPPSSDEDNEEDELFQLRTISRQSSVKLTVTGPPSPEPGRGASASSSRRSRSATPGVLQFCTYPGCPKAIEGFTKRANLVRHLRIVHGKKIAHLAENEEDSMDEMDGGVHVDGFLQPIKIRKGWRADDTQRRPPRRRRKKGRAGSEELDSDGRFL
ncbi:hypothetical protein MMYC01_200340 [Madurella mycetomatis]|uniref:Rrn9 domain-containing protein n=1 Tax=Madurella mycetomatis TaxID=100816 RepID=A0A175WH95_9PEZI|nr:hypothetical protein MMYC01_200340 [Madurella mycetomatis]